MTKLTSKQVSFIETMTKAESYERHGYELLLARPDYEQFFQFLEEKGLFNPSRNPKPVQNPDGHFRIPYWPALKYLEAVAKKSDEIKDISLAKDVMRIVRSVSNWKDQEGNYVCNYYTYDSFAKILGLVPLNVLNAQDMALIKIWMNDRFNNSLVIGTLSQGLLVKLLNSTQKTNLSKACKVLDYCTEIKWVPETGLEGVYKPETVADEYWLEKMMEQHASNFGRLTGNAAYLVLEKRVKEIFGRKGSDFPSSVYRAAVEDHEQNHSWRKVYNIPVEGLRDVMLSWLDTSDAKAVERVNDLIASSHEILRRIAIYLINKNWEKLNRIYVENLGSLFQSGHLHELYNLLSDQFSRFPEDLKKKTLNAIKEIQAPKLDNADYYLKQSQRRWLSAIFEKGHAPADAMFLSLNSDPELGKLSTHPDFSSYYQIMRGPGPSPYTPDVLIAMLEQRTLVKKLNDFKETGGWGASSVKGLVDSLVEAVQAKPEAFLIYIEDFLDAKSPYQYAVISGFKKLWLTAAADGIGSDWDKRWKLLIGFFGNLIKKSYFWELETQDDRLTPTRSWIVPEIAEFIKAGVTKDEKAFTPELLPASWHIITTLLEGVAPEEDFVPNDAMTYAINSTKGKIIEAIFVHALRQARVSERERGEHQSVWKEVHAVFENELNKKDNYEFATLAAAYMCNLIYLDKAWAQRCFAVIFSNQDQNIFICAVDGLAYAPESQLVYSFMIEHEVVERSLAINHRQGAGLEKVIERMGLAYLYDQDSLDSKRFKLLFVSERSNDLQVMINFFWQVHNEEMSEDQKEKVLCFWAKCHEIKDPPDGLLASLALLAVYIKKLDNRETNLMITSAKYAANQHRVQEFIENLDRLVEVYPKQTNDILKTLLMFYTPYYDFEGSFKSLLTKLYKAGFKTDVLGYLEQTHNSLPGMLALSQELRAAGA